MIASSVVIIVAFAFIATFIQRVTGFGFGIVFMSVVPFLMPGYGEATALSGLLALVCALGSGIKVFRYLKWKKLIPILCTFFAVSLLAVNIVASVDNHTLKKILGVILILVSLYFIFVNGKFSLKPTIPVQMCMGAASGLMGGLFGMQGPPAVIYFISSTDSKEEYMALTQWYFIFGNVAMALYRAGNGFMTADVFKLFAYGVPAVLAGLFLGSLMYRKMPVALLRKFVYAFIGIAGIAALLF